MEKLTAGPAQHIPFEANVFQGRLDTGLGILDLDIVSATETRRFDPNGIIMALLDGTLIAGEPLYPSILSGQPGFLYRNHELQFALTGEELQRFVSHSLGAEEFFKLYRAFGEFHEIHDDFYDPDTGDLLQPVGFIDEVPVKFIQADNGVIILVPKG